MIVLLYAAIGLVVLAILGVLVSYFISRGEESESHYRSEKAFEDKVRKLKRQDKLKKKRQHDPWAHK